MPLRLFIGFDRNEVAAYHVLCQSVLSRSSRPVTICPLVLSQLPMTRPRDPKQSTEFSFSRFLVPYLSGYEGLSLFMDCDMLVLDDIAQLFEQFDGRSAVQVVKHDYQPTEKTKFLGNEQTQYPCKNWSSVMLFNNALCPVLTPDYVNQASGLELHQFKWINPNLVGSLTPEWNHLVGNDTGNPKNLHYTLGGPWFKGFEDCPQASVWMNEYQNIRIAA